MPRSTLRLGTRGSLLARAQSRIVMRALKAANPGLQVQLLTVETRGDRNREVPLSQVDDPGFFSAEIDTALLDGDIDFAVHSVKDLPLTPRAGIVTAAIPPRENPREVLLFRPQIEDMLRRGEPLRIGSSSERRAAFVEDFLREALPRFDDREPVMGFHPLRGAVEERIARVRLPPSARGALDGVVLALAGLVRLWGDRDAHASIAPLLENLRLMVLPLSRCPAAPGQGALAVECRENDEYMTQQLAAIDDPATARRVRRELALLVAQPEAERGHFGATSIPHEQCGTLIFIRGRHDGQVFERLAWNAPPAPPSMARPWDGADWVRASDYRPLSGLKPVLASAADVARAPAVFLAHWRALTPGLSFPPGARVWVSGVQSWIQLARRGHWIEGCADNLGFDAIVDTVRNPVLRLPGLSQWIVLTREDAIASWRDAGPEQVLATYAIGPPGDADQLQEIRRRVAAATHFFWGSAAQYRALREWLPAGSQHGCGPGKTYRALRSAGATNVHAFPSRREWQKWVA